MRTIILWFNGAEDMEKILAVTSLTSRSQSTVPKEVRQILGLTEKDKIIWISEGNKITLRKA